MMGRCGQSANLRTMHQVRQLHPCNSSLPWTNKVMTGQRDVICGNRKLSTFPTLPASPTPTPAFSPISASLRPPALTPSDHKPNMSGKVVSATSASHFSQLLSQSTYLIVDFYADWCGPCKAIAPVFQNLAERETQPGKLVFVKVDVDAQQEIARKYSVSAMPTFLVIKSSSVVETIRGANPSALTAAVRKAVNDSSGPGGSSSFQSKGRTLGSTSQPSRTVNDGPLADMQRLIMGNGGLGDIIVRFVALYLISLFAFDAFKAAEDSAFNIRARR